MLGVRVELLIEVFSVIQVFASIRKWPIKSSRSRTAATRQRLELGARQHSNFICVYRRWCFLADNSLHEAILTGKIWQMSKQLLTSELHITEEFLNMVLEYKPVYFVFVFFISPSFICRICKMDRFSCSFSSYYAAWKVCRYWYASQLWGFQSGRRGYSPRNLDKLVWHNTFKTTCFL